jgi:hypothetical protein
LMGPVGDGWFFCWMATEEYAWDVYFFIIFW